MTPRRRNLAVVAGLGGILAVMLTLVAFSVPLYRLFCAATGYGGTPQRAASDEAALGERRVTVRFSTQTANDLPWRFEPVERSVTVRLGEERLVRFRATNLSDRPIVGHATFNVTPDKAGIYFTKIQCFCFTEERLGPGATEEMPVDFYVDPALASDPNTSEIDTITLSYSFFRATDPDGAEDLARFDPAAPADPARGARLFAERCGACHALDRNGIGPMLGGVVGRAAGSVPGYRYSAGVAGASWRWTEAALDRWLADPPAMAPGTKMPAPILDPATRRDIVAYLAAASAGAVHASR
jgi:cytochrome c oxidase assembly protein subunit 11